MTDTKLKVRGATDQDAPAITELHAEGWRQGYSHIFEPSLLERAIDERRTRWTDLASQPNFDQAILIVGERDDAILAFAHAGPAERHPGDLEIYSFYAHPTEWGTGLAREFMGSVLNTARSLGFKRVYLSAFRELGRARRFYEITGFHETGHTTESRFPDDVVVINVEYVRHLD